METCSPGLVPLNQSLMWFAMALAADMAEESPRASMIAAPLFWTVEMKSPWSHALSLWHASSAGLPWTVAWEASGNWVDEWLPQMITLCTSPTFAPALCAIYREKK